VCICSLLRFRLTPKLVTNTWALFKVLSDLLALGLWIYGLSFISFRGLLRSVFLDRSWELFLGVLPLLFCSCVQGSRASWGSGASRALPGPTAVAGFSCSAPAPRNCTPASTPASASQRDGAAAQDGVRLGESAARTISSCRSRSLGVQQQLSRRHPSAQASQLVDKQHQLQRLLS
jgi:hypothetical protein